MKKVRLDQLLIDRGMALTLDKARGFIGAGQVLVNEEPADKAGMSYPASSVVRLRKKCPYVSRGGLKLEQAIHFFDLELSGRICADIGASTGGFTDCLLQHGAEKVFAIDVAYGQLDWKIRQNSRVVVLERFNARNIEGHDLGIPIDLAVMDTSFISITKIIPALIPLFTSKVEIIALIKPQFELPKSCIGNGVIKDPALHSKAIEMIESFIAGAGLVSAGITPSPILGPKGNKEFLIHILSSSL